MSNFINRIEELEKEISLRYAKICSIRKNCNHIIVPDDPEDIEDSCRVCSECGERYYDWYCPDNPPTHKCEYGDYEGCIHCGNPQERK